MSIQIDYAGLFVADGSIAPVVPPTESGLNWYLGL